MNKTGRFAAFWVLFGIMGVLLLGTFITPFRIVLDDTFDRINTNAIVNGTPDMSCSNPESNVFVRGTCFTLRGFMIVFILYALYSWINGMTNGAKERGAVFAPRYRQAQEALSR